MHFAVTFALVAAPLLAQAVSPAHVAHAHRRNSHAGNELQKRLTSGYGTWYDVGLGACGWFNQPSDFIIAMNQIQFPQDGYPSSICGKQVGITGPAGYAVATVADECPTGNGNCNYGDMDMSKGLFTAVFGDLGVGKGPITWDWLDGSGGGNTGGNTGGNNGGGNSGGGDNGGNNGGNNGGDGGQQSQSTDPSPWTSQAPSSTPDPPPSSTPTPTPSPSSQSSQSQTSSSAASTTSGTVTTESVGNDNTEDFNKFMVQFQGLMYKGLDTQ